MMTETIYQPSPNVPQEGTPPVFKTKEAAKEYFGRFEYDGETRWVEEDVGLVLSKVGTVDCYGMIYELELHYE